jgi:FkbM family methyltransferase
MSKINLNWLKNSFNVTHPVIFDIGCANMHDSIMFKKHIQNSSVYAFECEDVWKPQNLITAKENNINYFHLAISHDDNPIVFYRSDTLNSEPWQWSGSIFPPADGLLTDVWKWKKSYTVNSISLNTFCKKYNVTPDFIHIDAQGAEYSIFKNLEPDYRPSIIWAEISAFSMYHTGVSYNDFYQLMISLGYHEIYKDSDDALYVINNNYAPYIIN